MQEENNLNHLLKTFARGSLILLFGIFLSKVFTYLYRATVARTFGQEMYGLFSLAIMISSFFISFFSLGLQEGLVRYISLYRGENNLEKIRSILRFSFNLALFVSFFAGGLLFLFADFISINFFHNSGLIIFLKLFAIFIPISIFANMAHAIPRSYEQTGWYSFIGNILSPSLQLLLLVGFIYIGWASEAIIFSHNLGILAILIVSLFISKYKFKEIFIKSNIDKTNKLQIRKKLLSYSWPIMFFGLVVLIFSWIDSFTIGYLKTASEVGIYNAAVPIATFLMIVPALFLQFFLPIIMKEYSKKNFELIKSLSKQIGRWIFLLNLPILILLILFPGAAINLLFGPEYLSAENCLRMLSVGIFFYSISLVSENLLSMIGKSKTILFNLLIASIVNITLNVLLILLYGIGGAAFSTMLSYTLWGLLSIGVAKRRSSIIPLDLNFLKILFIALIPTGLLLLVRSFISLTPLTTIVFGISFVLIYFFSLFITKTLNKNDLMILKTIKDKILTKPS